MFEGFLTIDEGSKIPKYQQVVDTIVSDIELGIVKVGDKIPSINETSEEYYLSRDTVEKAYKILRKRGIITAVRGKGFYVSSTGKKAPGISAHCPVVSATCHCIAIPHADG